MIQKFEHFFLGYRYYFLPLEFVSSMRTSISAGKQCNEKHAMKNYDTLSRIYGCVRSFYKRVDMTITLNVTVIFAFCTLESYPPVNMTLHIGLFPPCKLDNFKCAKYLCDLQELTVSMRGKLGGVYRYMLRCTCDGHFRF